MKAVHIIGPTGAGKSPLGEALERTKPFGRNWFHFDFGAQLRKVAKEGPSELFSEDEVRLVREVLSQGRLLEDHEFWIVERLFKRFLKERRVREGDLVVLNGVPRHEGQARAMESLVEVALLVELVADEGVLERRLRLDPAGDRKGRTDDIPSLVKKKLEWYEKRTKPLKFYYRERGIPEIRILVDEGDTAETLLEKFLRCVPKGLF